MKANVLLVLIFALLYFILFYSLFSLKFKPILRYDKELDYVLIVAASILVLKFNTLALIGRLFNKSKLK